uniref:hypothetical protein n=1 Tax=Trichocoleus desertorum TaxID=1481672 RepID=UPI0025B2CFA9|nr:hypothetical protein [Trichocoleus desertorum]
MKDYGPPLLPPFQCFMGQWEGLCKTFDLEGNFLEASAVHADIHWIEPKVWQFNEHFDNLYGYGAITFNCPIRVTGKTCYGEDAQLKIRGTELTPYNYIFQVQSTISQTTIFNNHYFQDPNQRRIITHKLQNGESHIFQIQDFVRVR